MLLRDPSNALRIDAAAECIWRDGKKVGVPPKAFLVLLRLMERPGQLVTKNDLLDAVWPDTHVTETVLNNAVGQLRQALGDDPKRPRFIETVHRRGFRWIGPAGAQAAPPAPASPLVDAVELHDSAAAPFVGRAESLAELGRCYARAAAGRRQLVLVSGEPGIGKTAVVDRFIDGLTRHAESGASPSVVARGQCIETYGAADLYRPLREAVEQLLRGGGEEIRALFRTHAPSWLLSMPELSSAAELETLRRRVITSTTESVQRELERALEAASAGRTVVLVLEDLHWSEPATIALLWALAVRREPARLMIIGTYRSVDAIAQQHPITRLKRELTAKRQCLELAIEGLPGDAVAAFLDRHFARHELSSAFAARLCDQTAGNPLFLLNALADFERRGCLQQQEGVWRCTVDLDPLFAAVPESTRELIAFRLDQLAASTRELLEVASLVGVTFATQTVAAAAERGCAEVETELEPLARAEFFLRRGAEVEWPDGTRGGEHAFRHALYRQVLLRGITPTRRQHLHRRIALALENGYGERVGEIAGALSVHHEQAGDPLRAVDYIEMLVQQAYTRSAVHEAEALLAHAVTLLKRAPDGADRQERLLKATVAHGLALHTVRGPTSVEWRRALDDARALGQSMPTTSERIFSLGTIAAGKFVTGHLREADSIGHEILALARVDAAAGTLVTAQATVGMASLYLGEIETALRYLEHAAENLPSATWSIYDYDPVVLVRMFLGLALIVSGRFEHGRASVESALQVARTMEMPIYLGAALTMAATTATVRRDLLEARQFATAGLDYGRAQNLFLFDELHRAVLGWVDVIETRDAKRIEPLREVVEGYGATGNLAASRLFCLLVEACLAVGRVDDAARALDAAFDARREERLLDANLLRLRATILLARPGAGSTNGAFEEAEQTFEQAIEIANTQGTRLFGLRATVDLCRLWLKTKKRDQARRRLSGALGAFDEGFGETDLREAKALLDDM